MTIFPTDLDDDWDWIDPPTHGDEMSNENEREQFESGAVRDKTDYRYDLCSPVVVDYLQRAEVRIVVVDIMEGRYRSALSLLTRCKPECSSFSKIIHLYAQALHEGAEKYGERNWEKGIPESNLKNHAIHHLVRWDCGDKSEPHLSHAIWNMITLIHFYDKPANENHPRVSTEDQADA